MPTERRAGWLVVCGYLLFESSQFFYVIFVLPAIIVIAISLLQTMQYKPRRATSITIICASLALSVFAITDVLKAKRVGEALEDGNRSASLAMRSYLDQHAANPLVLFASPTLHTGLQWPEVRPMTTQFQIFPVDTSQERSLLQWSPDYIEIIASGPASFYIGEVSDLKAIAQTHGDPVLRQPAYILDAGRGYFAPLDVRQDTVLLYRWR